jgi:hypothetical protein
MFGLKDRSSRAGQIHGERGYLKSTPDFPVELSFAIIQPKSRKVFGSGGDLLIEAAWC